MLTCHAPELLAYTCTTRAQLRIWRYGWCAETDSEDGRYIWFQSLEPLQRWMGSTRVPEKAEVPTVTYFLCNEAIHSVVKVFRAACGAFYTHGKGVCISPQFATIPPFRSPCVK